MKAQLLEGGCNRALRTLVVAVLVTLTILACRSEQSDQAPVITVNPEATSTPVSAVADDQTDAQDRCQRTISDSAATPLPSEAQALYRAIWAGTIAEVRQLVAAGADVNARDSDGDPLLYTAIWRDKLEALRILVDAEANVNGKRTNGESLLNVARWRGHDEVEEILLAAGATE